MGSNLPLFSLSRLLHIETLSEYGKSSSTSRLPDFSESRNKASAGGKRRRRQVSINVAAASWSKAGHVAAFSLSNDYLVLREKSGSTSKVKTKLVPWMRARNLRIVSMAFCQAASNIAEESFGSAKNTRGAGDWLLVASTDATVFLVPVEKLLNQASHQHASEMESFNLSGDLSLHDFPNSESKQPMSDILQIDPPPIKSPTDSHADQSFTKPNGSAVSHCVWWHTLTGDDFAILGSLDGTITFVNLRTKARLTTEIEGAIMKLEIVDNTPADSFEVIASSGELENTNLTEILPKPSLSYNSKATSPHSKSSSVPSVPNFTPLTPADDEAAPFTNKKFDDNTRYHFRILLIHTLSGEFFTLLLEEQALSKPDEEQRLKPATVESGAESFDAQPARNPRLILDSVIEKRRLENAGKSFLDYRCFVWHGQLLDDDRFVPRCVTRFGHLNQQMPQQDRAHCILSAQTLPGNFGFVGVYDPSEFRFSLYDARLLHNLDCSPLAEYDCPPARVHHLTPHFIFCVEAGREETHVSVISTQLARADDNDDAPFGGHLVGGGLPGCAGNRTGGGGFQPLQRLRLAQQKIFGTLPSPQTSNCSLLLWTADSAFFCSSSPFARELAVRSFLREPDSLTASLLQEEPEILEAASEKVLEKGNVDLFLVLHRLLHSSALKIILTLCNQKKWDAVTDILQASLKLSESGSTFETDQNLLTGTPAATSNSNPEQSKSFGSGASKRPSAAKSRGCLNLSPPQIIAARDLMYSLYIRCVLRGKCETLSGSKMFGSRVKDSSSHLEPHSGPFSLLSSAFGRGLDNAGVANESHSNSSDQDSSSDSATSSSEPLRESNSSMSTKHTTRVIFLLLEYFSSKDGLNFVLQQAHARGEMQACFQFIIKRASFALEKPHISFLLARGYGELLLSSQAGGHIFRSLSPPLQLLVLMTSMLPVETRLWPSTTYSVFVSRLIQIVPFLATKELGCLSRFVSPWEDDVASKSDDSNKAYEEESDSDDEDEDNDDRTFSGGLFARVATYSELLRGSLLELYCLCLLHTVDNAKLLIREVAHQSSGDTWAISLVADSAQQRLEATLTSYRGQYPLSSLLTWIIDKKNWAAAACVYESSGEWKKGLKCRLQLATQTQDYDKPILLVSSHIIRAKEQERVSCLDKLLRFWETQQPEDLENCLLWWRGLELALLKHLSELAPALSFILLEQKHASPKPNSSATTLSRPFDSFSSNFYLLLVKELVSRTSVQQGNAFEHRSSRTNRLWSEILSNLTKLRHSGILSSDLSSENLEENSMATVSLETLEPVALRILEEENNQVENMRVRPTPTTSRRNYAFATRSLPSLSSQSGLSVVVAFSCYHTFPKKDFVDFVLPEFSARLNRLAPPIPITAKAMIQEYSNEVIGLACPRCAFNQILREEREKARESQSPAAGMDFWN